MSIFGRKKHSDSRRPSDSSNLSVNSFAKFDEKKDYCKRCKNKKEKPVVVTFSLK
uniref:Uncharacterized protein n=1 Tax=Candida parapsilosis (strain CDC 317 / ATCC MYA-4646) TaxID=578454 RepID=A0AAJ8VXS4_CANPC